MSGIFDYLKWRGDIPVSSVPICDADKLILSELCYIDLDASHPKPIPELCLGVIKKLAVLKENGIKASVLHHRQDERLLSELALSERFRDVKIGNFEKKFSKESEEQFGAMTVFLPDGSLGVVFRGTDWSLIGWKEDINMAFGDELPAQRSAVDYLNRIASMYHGKITVFGHSKGGNLAVYASAFCLDEVRRRITHVTNLDGPGFSEGVVKSDGFRAISSRMTTYIPRASIVGAFFINNGKFSVIKSRASGLLQHIPYNWEIMGGGFVTAERDVTTGHLCGALNEWITSLTVEQRRQFVETLWSVVADANVNELSELFEGKNTLAIIRNYNSLDENSRRMVSETLDKLNALAKGYLREIIGKGSK